MTKRVVGTVGEIAPGQGKIIEVDGISVGVFNVNGNYYALRNRCPHQGGPLCLGSVTGTTLPSAPGEYLWARDGEILRCPWHGWEFDLLTGRSIFNPHKVRVRAYDVSVEPRQAAQAANEDPAVDTFTVTMEADQLVLDIPE